MTDILFDGAEKPSHRKLLESMGVKRLALSFWRLRARGLPKKGYLIDNYFEEDADVYVDSGWMQANEKLAEDELLEYAAQYDEFIQANLGRIAGATELHLDHLGKDWINDWRDRYSPFMGDAIWPVWLDSEGTPELFTLAQSCDNVALPNSALTSGPVIPPRLNAMHQQFGTTFHALGVADPSVLRNVPLGTASTIAWASPQMRGETIVWDGTRLVRYRSNMKKQARSRYKAVAEKAGISYEDLMADSTNESTRLAIWSYQQLEESMDKKRPNLRVVRPDEGSSEDIDVTERAKRLLSGNTETDGGHVDIRDDESLNPMLPSDGPGRGLERPQSSGSEVSTRSPSERRTLPVFGVKTVQSVEMEDGHQVIRERPVLQSQSKSHRKCDTCFLSASCPAFTPGADCAYDLPVEVKTKEQKRALLDALLEMQAQRVAFARFAEEVNGGYPDPNVSQEMDRFFKMMANIKDLENNNEFVRLTVERQQSAGILSSIFGERAKAAQTYEQPLDPDAIIHQVMDPDQD